MNKSKNSYLYISNMADIILASKSPRRIELLKAMGLKFKIEPSNVIESNFITANLTPEEIAKKIALEKASSVAKNKTDGIIIGADTIVVLNDAILGKPRNKAHAIEMLKKLNNTTHKVITGIAIIKIRGITLVDSVTTFVTMRKITDDEIIDYVNSKEPLDAAGAYKIQEKGHRFIEKIDGDYENVIGLPLSKFKEMLEKVDNSIKINLFKNSTNWKG
ncbi:MAG: Maf family protein [Candidatus Helarchaeota archaeon]